MEKKQTRRRQVHFPVELEAVIGYIPTRQDLTDEEIKTKWFSKTDFIQFKRTAEMIARSSRDFGMSSALANCYEDEASLENQHRLNQWSRHGTIRRGLEYWCSTELYRKRGSSMHKVTDEVLQAQKAMKENECRIVDPCVLAALSRARSSAARTFAQMLGVADACAVEPPTSTSSQARMLRLGQRHQDGIPQSQHASLIEETCPLTTGSEQAGRGTDESEQTHHGVDEFPTECKNAEEHHLLHPTKRRSSKRNSRSTDKTFASTAA